MDRLLKEFQKRPLTLIVSLPRNDPELARAAVEGGAQALKIHINVHHDASGTHFGSFADEKPAIQKILKIAEDVPVGIVPGADTCATEDEIDALASMGIDYIDMYLDQMPAWLRTVTSVTRIAAVKKGYSLDRLLNLNGGSAHAVEAAIVPSSGYGKKLLVGDLHQYISLAIGAALPIIVPSQRKLTPFDVDLLGDAGVRAIMIGAIVTGTNPKDLEWAARTFRNAMDAYSRKIAEDM